ncbi:DUF4429 domain-containing protein [Bacillus sp. JJ722]|uniref:DUF4429 domain-containing protein n=1 Tax=Bacillus sp. JJ722 TaxID=3122973 RepID=UPI002FFF0C03
MSKVIEFKSVDKVKVTLDGNFLRFKRRGAINLMIHGMDGEKTIDINNISGVQLKKAGTITSGYIQFLIIGSQENKKGLFSATQDENTIMFIKKEQEMAEEIKSYIENILATKNTQPVLQGVNAADEIRKFKELADEGIISEEEFRQKKMQLLGI